MPRLVSLAALAAAASALTACTPPLAVDAAEHAADPRCAEVMLAVPETVGGLPMRATTSQATVAYGSEFPIVVRCGVEVPPPSEDPCFTLTTSWYDIDWVSQDVGEYRVAVTYGKDPAVEVVVPLIRADEAAAEILTALSPSADLADDTGRRCVGFADAAQVNAE